MKRNILMYALIVSIVFFLVGNVFAGKQGLKTNYTKMVVGNLPVGKTISMKKIANAPIVIGNNYENPVFITVRSEIPIKITEGYEPIPNPDWIQFESRGVTVAANSEVSLDVLVVIPDDTSIFNKKYQSDIVISTKGDDSKSGMFTFGFQIKGKFLFSIAPGRNDQGLENALASPADASYILTPPQVVVWDVEPGKLVEIKTEDNKWVELHNQSSKKQEYWCSSVEPTDTNYTFFPGSHFAGNVDDVSLHDEKIILGRNKKESIKMTIKVPKGVSFEAGPLAYLIRIASGNRKGVARYISVYLYDKSKEEIVPAKPDK